MIDRIISTVSAVKELIGAVAAILATAVAWRKLKNAVPSPKKPSRGISSSYDNLHLRYQCLAA